MTHLHHREPSSSQKHNQKEIYLVCLPDVGRALDQSTAQGKEIGKATGIRPQLQCDCG